MRRIRFYSLVVTLLAAAPGSNSVATAMPAGGTGTESSCSTGASSQHWCFFKPQWYCFNDDGTEEPRYSFCDPASPGCVL